MSIRVLLILLLLLLAGRQEQAVADPIILGSKKFTENVIVAEITARLLEHHGHEVIHKRELGGTRILWDALLRGEIDAYPEYTGTLIYELFAGKDIKTTQQLDTVLSGQGIALGGPLGFNNTYVLGMLDSRAAEMQIETISDLLQVPQLRFGFSNEFISRADGWSGLRDRYRLGHANVTGLDHDLAYRGLADNRLDVIDLYSTDAEITYYGIRPLIDDKAYFPQYLAVILYRHDLADAYPDLPGLIRSLAGQIDNDRMSAMNADVKISGMTETGVAAAYLDQEFGIRSEVYHSSVMEELLRNTANHLMLVVVSLSAAVIVAIPLGIISARRRRFGQLVLAAAGIIQTIPTLALLVFMIPLLGIGGPPAVAALFLYSLFPIIRNTYSGLHDIPAPLIESAIAMGLPPLARLRLVELPLATRSILAGVKISAVINVGTATLGALIGAGGYGQPILTGIRLNDTGLILQGAVPAALLALLVQGLFEVMEERLLPRGLKYVRREN